MDSDPLLQKMTQELRRGSLVLAVLLALRREHYAYSLRKYLSDHGLDVDEGTLYPLVRRLEKEAVLTSEWREEQSRKRRFYRLSSLGNALLPRLQHEWQHLANALTQIENSTHSPNESASEE
ncbi:PadR family transcriptional regulator [Simiduia litorea]|uniref:PadR family transcriptional regulator n=1 Tax=Simiduia litorea TaxID=1435348 RepID=UPI0036F308BA